MQKIISLTVKTGSKTESYEILDERTKNAENFD